MAQTIEATQEIENTPDERPEFDADVFKDGVDKLNLLREKGASNNQEIGAHIKELEDQHGFNKQAVKDAQKWSKKSEEAFADYWRTFLPAIKAMGLLPSADLVDLAEARS